MSFIKDSANKEPIVDTVFGIVNKARVAKAELGIDKVVDGTIGSLYDEDGKLVALDTVFNSFRSKDNRVLAAYATSITGNPDFKAAVYNWVLNGNCPMLRCEVIATPGGTGAIDMTINECLDPGQTLILPSIAWGSYKIMAEVNELNIMTYDMFEGNQFNLESYKKACKKVMKKQKRLVIVMNDPCHNPTGYSLSDEEWKEVIEFLNECSKTHSVVLLNDIAYIDFAFGQERAKDYMKNFNDISDNVIVVIAFSLSKSMTSYGMRCGAALVLGKTKAGVKEVKNVFEKNARAVWSNVNNASMVTFVDIMNHHLEEYNQERLKYVNLLKERADTFIEEANACELSCYPYKEGFFVTLKMESNDIRDAFHEAMMEHHIYTIKVNKGIRVAMCSLSLKKIKGLAPLMKEILESIEQ